MSAHGLDALIGKRIDCIITVQGRQSGPHDQLVLLFDDNTHFEIFGSGLGWSGHVFPGGRDEVIETLHPEGGRVEEIRVADRTGD